MRPAKAHRRATTPQPVPGSVAVEPARQCRDDFERIAAEMREWVARDLAIDAACVVARSQEEFDALVDQMKALLLASE